jgi:hypothetical protein
MDTARTSRPSITGSEGYNGDMNSSQDLDSLYLGALRHYATRDVSHSIKIIEEIMSADPRYVPTGKSIRQFERENPQDSLHVREVLLEIVRAKHINDPGFNMPRHQ